MKTYGRLDNNPRMMVGGKIRGDNVLLVYNFGRLLFAAVAIFAIRMPADACSWNVLHKSVARKNVYRENSVAEGASARRAVPSGLDDVFKIHRGGFSFIPAGYNPFGYTLTDVGRKFLEFDGSRDCDVGRFLATFKAGRKKRKALKEQWLEIIRVSKTGQSMRIYRLMDDLLDFCVQAGDDSGHVVRIIVPICCNEDSRNVLLRTSSSVFDNEATMWETAVPYEQDRTKFLMKGGKLSYDRPITITDGFNWMEHGLESVEHIKSQHNSF